MRKFFLSVVLIGIFMPQIHPITYTNKTFMAVPTAHYLLPTKYTSWHRILKQGSSDPKAWGGTFQMTPFYRMSNNASKLGRYFGANAKHTLKIDDPKEGTDIQGTLIMHRPIGGGDPLRGTIKLDPKQTRYGIYFSYNQELANISKGLFFRVNIPFVHVENDLRTTATTTKKFRSKGILDFFSGNYTNDDEDSLQEALCCAKICGPRGSTGIDDIELLLGGRLTEKKEHEVNGTLKIIIPTGNKPTGEYLFEPIVGNGKHWGIGFNLNASMNVVRNETHNLECLFEVESTYLFKADEKRTLGYRNGISQVESETLVDVFEDIPVTMAWNYYILGGEKGKGTTFPLANVLTRDLSVSPGTQVQGHASFAYHRNNTTVDFGYSFFAQEGETVSLKTCWEKDKYAPVAPLYDTQIPFDATAFIDPGLEALGRQGLGHYIQEEELDLSTPSTPGFVRHAIHGAISHTLAHWENPIMLGCGFSVDWNQSNANPIGYALWAKLGASF